MSQKCPRCREDMLKRNNGYWWCNRCREVVTMKELMVNNPNGYGKHKKNPNPKKEEKLVITKEMIAEAYRDYYKAKRECQSKQFRYNFLKRKFFSLEEIEEKIDKEYDEK